MNLQDLPAELIYLICEDLCLHCYIDRRTYATFRHIDSTDCKSRQITLSNLCLLCKRWSNIAQRVLYHTYGFPERSDRGDIRFCRTICEKPELGRFVERIYLKYIPQLDWDLDQQDDAWLLKSLDKFSDILNPPLTPFNFEHRSVVSVCYTNHLASSTKYRRSSNGYSKSRPSDAAIQETIQQSSEYFSS